MRCGQDSDCNPASAAGILGTMIGFSNIPDYWKQGLDKIEDVDFKYTDISLNDVYKMGFKHAIRNIERNGGSFNEDNISLIPQESRAVKYEKGFKGHYPVEIIQIEESKKKLFEDITEYEFEFEGIGFVLKGKSAVRSDNKSGENYNHIIDVYLDNKLLETVSLPTDFIKRRNEICWKYNLNKRKHHVKIKLQNPRNGYHVLLYNTLIYDNEP